MSTIQPQGFEEGIQEVIALAKHLLADDPYSYSIDELIEAGLAADIPADQLRQALEPLQRQVDDRSLPPLDPPTRRSTASAHPSSVRPGSPHPGRFPRLGTVYGFLRSCTHF